MRKEFDNLKLDYVECGKLFYFQRNTSDFVLLDTSDRELGLIVNREIYQPNIANYAARYNLRFSNKPNQFGNFSVILQPSRAFIDELLFIQVQQRTELDYLYMQPNVEPRTDLPNRPYTQAHITIIPRKLLTVCLQNDIALYDAILFRKSNGFSLKDYGVLNPNGQEVRPQVLPRPLSLKPFILKQQDLPIVKGITNILYNTFMQLILSKIKSGMILPSIVFFTPELKMNQRLAIMQAVQKQLLPIFGILTFALDYAIPPESQIYFCEHLPDKVFPITKQHIFTTDKIISAAEDPKGYFQTAVREGLSRLSDPVAVSFFRKGIAVDDALVISDTLKSEVASNDKLVFEVFLRNLDKLESKHKEKLVRIFTKSSNQLMSFVNQIPKYNLQRVERLELYKSALMEPLRKQSSEGLDLFLDVYLLILRQKDDIVEFRSYLQQLINTQPSFILTRIKSDDQTELISELLELCCQYPTNLSNESNFLLAIFSQPTSSLFLAIDKFYRTGNWNNAFQQTLTYALANVDTQWTDDDVNKLENITPIRINNLKRIRFSFFLNSEKKIAEYKNLPNAKKAETLLKKIDSALGQEKNIFQVIDKDQHQKAREVALIACNTASLENFKFVKYWLGHIGWSGALNDKEFWHDYEIICNNCVASQPQLLDNQDDRDLYDLLKGRINHKSGSIEKVCTSNNIQNRYLVILAGMLTNKQEIPIHDVKWIINNLPDTNNYAVEVIHLANDSPKFMESVKTLDEKYCRKWLDVTFQNNLRNMYIENNARDLLHETLFRIDLASNEYLLDLLTKDSGMKAGVVNWSSYVLKTQKLIDSRLKNDAINTFLEIVRDSKDIGFNVWEYVKKIRKVVELLEKDFRTDELPELAVLSDLMEFSDSFPANLKFTESFTKALIRIAEKTSDQDLVNKYHPLLLYCCSDFISIHSPETGKNNNFHWASEKVLYTGLASVI